MNKGTATEADMKRILDGFGLDERAPSAFFSLIIHLPAHLSLACPIWLLEGVRDHLFNHLGLCWLHIELEGNLKHLISAIVDKFTMKQLQSTRRTPPFVHFF